MSLAAPPRAPWITYLLMGSTVLVFIGQMMNQLWLGTDFITQKLAFSPEAFAQGSYWTLLTYGWVHSPSSFGVFGLHLLTNMIMLYNFGPVVEKRLGPWRFLALYLGSVVAAVRFWWWTSPAAGSEIIGASGAIFGLIAAVGILAPRVRVVIYFFFFLPIPMTLGIFALVVCGLELLQLVFGWLPEIAHAAHLGGAGFGLVYVLILKQFGHLRSGTPSQMSELR